MNKVILEGRLTRDVDIHYSTGENANANCRFTVAVDRNFKNKDGQYDADFISCVAWGKTAEFVNKWFHKGDPIILCGNIRTGSYTNKDGVKVYTTDVYVDEVGFVPAKKSTEGTPTQTAADPDFMNIPDGVDEELPWG